MKGSGKVPQIGRRFTADGWLVLTGHYRWEPRICASSTRGALVRFVHQAPFGGYEKAVALDELDRRAPKTASYCTDPEIGWVPIVDEKGTL